MNGLRLGWKPDVKIKLDSIFSIASTDTIVVRPLPFIKLKRDSVFRKLFCPKCKSLLGTKIMDLCICEGRKRLRTFLARDDALIKAPR
jgi:hypothetical protein